MKSQFLWYVIIIGLVLNLLANMIWKYLPNTIYHLDKIVTAILVFICLGLLVFYPDSSPSQTRGFLQFDKVNIVGQDSAIAPGRQFAVNMHSLNPGPERIINTYGHSWAFVEDVDEQTDRRVRMLVNKELTPLRQQYLAGKIKGPEVGVGKGTWGTVATPPLTQREVDGIRKGTTRMYFVSWFAWTDLQGHKDSGYDCRWLQGHTLPAPYSKEDVVWHFCE